MSRVLMVDVYLPDERNCKMRMLFELDKKDYNPNGSTFCRPSVRGIIIRNGKVAMVHSQKYDYYKFPGGGIEDGESKEDIFIQDNYYYLCDVEQEVQQQNLDKYEEDEGFILAYVVPQFAVDKNRKSRVDEFSRKMLERDARVLEILIQEGYFNSGNLE